MIIYKATNKVNGKCYIGQSGFDLEKRKQEHIKSSRKTKPDFYFHRAIKKYKQENFKWEVIDECDYKDETNELEKKYIIEFKSLSKQNGYNISLNACGGDNFTNHPDKEKIRKKISKKTKEGIKNSGKSWSESHIGDKNGMFGQSHSQKSLKKMSENRKGIATGDDNGSTKNAGLYKITLPDNKQIIITNVRKFCRENRLLHGPFYDMCNGKKHTKYKGYWCERISMAPKMKRQK